MTGFHIPDDLGIPEFLKRDPAEITTLPRTVRARKAHKIDYPRDGYACKGMRKEARERHRERLRRRADRMRKFVPRKRRRWFDAGAEYRLAWAGIEGFTEDKR